MSVIFEIAKLSEGQKINNFRQIQDKDKDISVALWTAGEKKFLLLKSARKFVGFEQLPEQTTLSKAVEEQDFKFVAMQGGKA